MSVVASSQGSSNQEAIYQLLKDIKTLPPSPQILPRILEALNDEQTTLEEVGDLISLDSVLTAKLLHYCNSVYFSGREPVSTVPEAIGRVGFETIFALVSAVAGKNSFGLPAGCGIDPAELWKHSLITAFGSKFVAADVAADGNLWFTGGMLHDIGRVVLAMAKGEAYGRLVAEALRVGAQTQELEFAAYGFTHAEVGATLMETWKLPAVLVAGVRYHHTPSRAGQSKMIAAGIAAGNGLAYRFEHPAENLVEAKPELLAALDILGLDNRHLQIYDEQMQENWEFVSRVLEMQ